MKGHNPKLLTVVTGVKGTVISASIVLACSIPALANLPGQEKPSEIIIGGSHINVQVAPGPTSLSRAQIMDWIKKCATSVSRYYGHFPTERTTIRVMPFNGHGFGFATTDSEGDHGLIVIPLGNSTSEADLDRDWVLTHEMVHLAFPLVYPRNRWLVEGMATYIEPMGRMQAGYLTREKIWGDLIDDLPKGLPEAGDAGLGEHAGWGRTYWGGALFCFLADLEIRQATDNKKGLQQALQAIDSTEGDITSDMEVEDALKIGDKAVAPDSRILRNLYDKMTHKAVAPDLAKIWLQLGIKRSGKQVIFDDSAPLANTRKAIEAGN